VREDDWLLRYSTVSRIPTDLAKQSAVSIAKQYKSVNTETTCLLIMMGVQPTPERSCLSNTFQTTDTVQHKRDIRFSRRRVRRWPSSGTLGRVVDVSEVLSRALMMDDVSTCVKSVNFYKTIRRNIRAGWTGGWVGPEPVWTQRTEEKSFASVGDRAPVSSL
jgi:hypothetical protein